MQHDPLSVSLNETKIICYGFLNANKETRQIETEKWRKENNTYHNSKSGRLRKAQGQG